MTPVLDHPEVRESLMPISVEFYHEMGRLGMIGEDVELLEGFLIKTMSKSPLHSFIVRRCQHALQAALREGMFIIKEDPITMERSEPEPDLAVIDGNEEDFARHHPATARLIIEVSVSTLQKDRSKAMIYAGAGVPEYWLIEPEAKRVTVYHLPEADGYRDVVSYSGENTVGSQVLPGFTLNLTELFE